MIFENLKPRIDEAITLLNQTKQPQEIILIYNEISYKSAMNECFEYLFSESIGFETIYKEYRFVVKLNNSFLTRKY